jgi:hypothetical protein
VRRRPHAQLLTGEQQCCSHVARPLLHARPGSWFAHARTPSTRRRRANFTVDTRACQPPHDKYPFCDPARSLSDRVGDLISRIPDGAPPRRCAIWQRAIWPTRWLTRGVARRADAKPHLLTARGWPQGNIRNLSDIGVPAFDWGLNCIHGTQSTCKGEICPTSFPNPNSLGATWSV